MVNKKFEIIPGDVKDPAQLVAKAAAKVEYPETQSIFRIESTGPQPLSSAQRSMWFLDKFEPDKHKYNLPSTMYLSFKIETADLEEMLGEIINRHDSLRTTFPEINGEPYQLVGPKIDYQLPQIDMRGISEDLQRQKAQEHSNQDGLTPFALATGPLFRAQLYLLSSEKVLTVTMHHIISDGESMRVFFEEVMERCASYQRGEKLVLPELPIRYIDYSFWQRNYIKGRKVLEKDLNYWKQQLRDLSFGTMIPGDRPRPPVRAFAGLERRYPISGQLVAEIAATSQSHKVTYFDWWMTVFMLLAYRCTNQSHIQVGGFSSNRKPSVVKGLVGFFVNAMILKSDFTGEMTFAAAVKVVRGTKFDTLKRQGLPFDELVARLQPPRDLAMAPFMQMIFDLRDVSILRHKLPGFRFTTMEPEFGTAAYDLHFCVEKMDSGHDLICEYSTDIYDAATIDRLANNFLALAAASVAGPECPISALNIFQGPDRVNPAWQPVAPAAPGSAPLLHQLFEAQADRNPEAVALVCADQALSYGQLEAQANSLASYLQQNGVTSQAPVGIYLNSTPELIIAILGVLKAGAAYLALDCQDPAERVTGIIAAACPPIILTTSVLAANIPASTAQVVALDTGAILAAPVPRLASSGEPGALCAINYIDNDTTELRGVLQTHQGLANLAESLAAELALKASDRVLQACSAAASNSLLEIFPALFAGATLVLAGATEPVPGKSLTELLQRSRVTCAILRASYWELLSSAQLPGLKTVVIIGRNPAPKLLERWGSGRRCLSLTGSAETGACTHIGVYQQAGALLSVRPLANMELYVLDGGSKSAPIGIVGELYVGGLGLAAGYRSAPELARFVELQVDDLPRRRLFKTNDLVRRTATGGIEYVGRTDQQVELWDRPIELAAIAARLRAQAGVAAAVVRVDNGKLLAYLVTSESRASAASVRAWEAELDFWRPELSPLPGLLDLPTDKARPPQMTGTSSQKIFTVAAPEVRNLKALAGPDGVSSVALAVFKVLLYRYSGQSDIVVGLPVASSENYLVHRSTLAASESFTSLLEQVRATQDRIAACAKMPIEILQKALIPQPDPSYNSLFQVTFSYATVEMAEADFALSSAVRSGFNYDLGLRIIEDQAAGEPAWTVQIDYSTALFNPDTIARLAGHFQRLIVAAGQDATVAVGRLALLTDAELKLFRAWDGPWSEPGLLFCRQFAAQVLKTPAAIAVVCCDAELSYLELDRKSNQLASYLVKAGVGPDFLVGLCVERTSQMMIGLLGILKSGGAYLPIDPTYPADRILHMLSDSQATVLLTMGEIAPQLPAHTAQTICLDSDWEQIAAESCDFKSAPINPDQLAYIIYTSGSTGKPKGVQIERGNMTNFLNAMRRQPGITGADTLLAVTTISFDIHVLELFLPLIVGAKVVVAERNDAIDARALQQLMVKHSCTMMQATPATWHLLLELEQPLPLKALCGGEAITAELASQLLASCRELWNMYGPTETTVWSTVAKLGPEPITVGRPIDNTEIYIVDLQLQEVPIGVPGELLIGGAGVVRGYLGRPDLTAGRFINQHDLSSEPSTLYRTGDMAQYLPDGRIVVLGRLDNQVKIRGFRVELGEVESVLIQHPAVDQAVVVVREDNPGDQRLVANLIATKGEQKPDLATLRTHLQGFLPVYMLPSALVWLDKFPLTPNNKVDRRALKLRTQAPGGQSSKLAEQAKSLVGSVFSALQASLPRQMVPGDYLVLEQLPYFEPGQLGQMDLENAAGRRFSIRGYQPPVADIEATLQAYPGVLGAQVVAGGSSESVAYITGIEAQSIDLAVLQRFLESHFASYRLPAKIVWLDKLPLVGENTPSLSAPVAAPLAETVDLAVPQTKAERLVAGIFQEVLKIDGVGRYDNFFNLGGHSLLSMKVVARFEKATKIKMHPSELFQQTVGQIAASHQLAIDALPAPRAPKKGKLGKLFKFLNKKDS